MQACCVGTVQCAALPAVGSRSLHYSQSIEKFFLIHVHVRVVRVTRIAVLTKIKWYSLFF
jgi:hypothetical protein